MKTVSVAESMTCGNLASKFGSVSGASKYFKGGIVCYWLEAKENILNISNKELTKVNCVSVSVAKQMAKNVSNLFNTDFGLSTTGYAEDPKNYKEFISDKSLLMIPHAYICLYDKSKDIYINKLVKNSNCNRVEMQNYVVDACYKLFQTEILAR